VLMLGMMCAIVGSATYLTIATRFTMPVSTTHSIMGGVIGVGIAASGPQGINWSFKGVSQVFAAWGIAPGISGGFGAIIFLITKYGVMRRNNPVYKAFFMVPVYFFVTSFLLSLLICWKGGSAKIDLTDIQAVWVSIVVGVVVALVVATCKFSGHSVALVCLLTFKPKSSFPSCTVASSRVTGNSRIGK
jgi:sodium-dependent phosphate transporter